MRNPGRQLHPSADTAGATTARPPGFGPGAREGAQRGAGSQPLGATDRRDAWWLQPVAQALGLIVLGLYATWAAIQGRDYLYEQQGAHYLSPLYSPLLKPKWWPLSPAFLILALPGGFRATCYYYRKAYYRAFFADPMACAVGELRARGYRGETSFPFVLQNLHRFFAIPAVFLLAFLWWDVGRAFVFDGHFGVGLGSLVIAACVGLLTLYTFSCHTLRHLIGGRLDCFSCAAMGGPRYRGWMGLTMLNEHHMAWAWWSLFGVTFADLYVRLCALGVWHDLRILG